MQIDSSRFGVITIADSKIITFPEGLPGLENLTRYTLLSTEDTEPFHWLQSVQDPEVALAVINPYLLFPDYKPMVPEMVMQEMLVQDTEDVLVLTVAVIPSTWADMTTNLMAPVLINTANNRGRQIILEDTEYALRTPIFELVRRLVSEEESKDVGSD